MIVQLWRSISNATFTDDSGSYSILESTRKDTDRSKIALGNISHSSLSIFLISHCLFPHPTQDKEPHSRTTAPRYHSTPLQPHRSG